VYLSALLKSFLSGIFDTGPTGLEPLVGLVAAARLFGSGILLVDDGIVD
jgi:hypothetical protein